MYRGDADYQLVELRWYDTRFCPREPTKESSLNNDCNNPYEGPKSIKACLAALPSRCRWVSSLAQMLCLLQEYYHRKRNAILITFVLINLFVCIYVSSLFSFLKRLKKERKKIREKDKKRKFIESSSCLIVNYSQITDFTFLVTFLQIEKSSTKTTSGGFRALCVYKWNGQNKNRCDSRFCEQIYTYCVHVYVSVRVYTPTLLYRKSAVNHCRRGVRDTGSHTVVGGLKLTR